MLRGLLVTGGAVLAIGVAGELVAPGLVGSGVEDTVRASTEGAVEVDARTSGFPFLPALLLDGSIAHLELRFREAAGIDLTVATLALRADGIQLDRSAMYRGDVVVTGVEGGTVTVVLDEAALGEALGSPVELSSEIVALAGPVLEVAGTAVLDVSVVSELLPCTPQLEEADGSEVRLSCTFDGVPALLRPAGEG